MTHRERVLCTLEHEEPDRVPIDLGSVGSLLVDPLYFEVRKLLGIDEDIPPYRSGSTANYYDERVLKALDIDFRHLWLSSPDKPKAIKNPDGTVRDDWGIVWSAEGSYPVHFPLKELTENDLGSYRWPCPEVPWDLSELKKRAEILYGETQYALAAKSVLSGGGILERCYYLRSIEEFFR